MILYDSIIFYSVDDFVIFYVMFCGNNWLNGNYNFCWEALCAIQSSLWATDAITMSQRQTDSIIHDKYIYCTYITWFPNRLGWLLWTDDLVESSTSITFRFARKPRSHEAVLSEAGNKWPLCIDSWYALKKEAIHCRTYIFFGFWPQISSIFQITVVSLTCFACVKNRPVGTPP